MAHDAPSTVGTLEEDEMGFTIGEEEEELTVLNRCSLFDPFPL